MKHDPMIKAMATAVRPWASVHAALVCDLRLDRRQHLVDQRDIDDCLCCPKPECTNCKRYSKNRYGYVARPKPVA